MPDSSPMAATATKRDDVQPVANERTYQVTFIKHAGVLAYDVGRYTMSVPVKGGGRRQDRGKYLTVWRRQPDGEWRIAADTFSSDLPPAG